jgi:hypothetical protein
VQSARSATMVKHRRAAAVSTADIVTAMNLIPFVNIQQGKPLYVLKDFKTVPDWSRGQKLIPCLHKIVELTSGRGILHLNMRSGVVAWGAKHELGLNDATVDDIAYSIRALLNQVLNMKSRGRLIPPPWRPKYQTLFDKLLTNDSDDDDDVGDEVGEMLVQPMPSPKVLERIASDEIDAMEVARVC